MLSFSHRTICCQILRQVRDDISGRLDAGRSPGEPGGGGGVDAGGVVYEVGREGGTVPDLLVGEIPGELVDDGRDHLHVAQFFGPYICIENAHQKPIENTAF